MEMIYFGRKEAGRLVSVESKSVDVASKGFEHITEKEFNDFMAALPTPPTPEVIIPIDPKKLKKVLKVKGIITDESEIEIG